MFVGFCVWSLFCNAVLNVLSSFFTVEERAGYFTLIVFLLSCSGTCKYVMCLPLQCRGLVYRSVIVAFPQFPGLIPTVLLFCVISDGYTNVFY